MLFVTGLLALAQAFLIPLAVSLRSSGQSRRHSDSLLVGLFVGAASVGLEGALTPPNHVQDETDTALEKQ